MVTAQVLYAIDEPFYFSHHFDFRGRVYKNGLFSYDRGDLYRGLLEFAESQQVTDTGYRRICIHTAGLLEMPKGFTHDDMIASVEEMKDVIKK